MVQLQFSTQGGIESALIRRFTWSDISHVDLVLPDGRLLGAHMSGGVRIREQGYATFSKRILAVVDTSAGVTEQVYAAALSQVGKPYDWKGILNFGTQRNWRDTVSWFCSELVAWCFERARHYLLNIGGEVWRISPRDLLLSLLVRVQEVWTGEMRVSYV